MLRKIKVLQITAIDLAVRFLLLPLIDKLEKEGYEVHIACSNGPYVKELLKKGYRIKPIKIERKIAPFSNLISLWKLYKFMKKEKFDIVHAHTPVAGVLGRIAAKIARVPIIIYTAHGFYFHEEMNPFMRKIFIWIEKVTGRWFTDFIFTQSAEDFEVAIKEGIIGKEKIKWISNGVDVKSFIKVATEKKKNESRERIGLESSHKVIGFIGRLVEEKGIFDLVKAMKKVVNRFPEARLLIIGDTLESERDKESKKRLFSLIQISFLKDKIIFTGFVESIEEVLPALDLFVLPSYREGMPRSIIEAMACAKPVVATNIRGCREEVIDGVTGFLVPTKNPQKLAEAIIKILSDSSLAKRMGKAGQKRAIKEFDEQQVLERQLKTYNSLVKEKLLRHEKRDSAFSKKVY